MAKSLKSNGIEELRQVRRRVIRQHSLGRITTQDKDYLMIRLNEMEARIIEMMESGSSVLW